MSEPVYTIERINGLLCVREAGEWPVLWDFSKVERLEQFVDSEEREARRRVRHAAALRAALERWKAETRTTESENEHSDSQETR